MLWAYAATGYPNHWSAAPLALMFILGPMILASHVLSVTRRGRGVYKTTDNFLTLLAFLAGPCDGWVFVHRMVLEEKLITGIEH